MNKLNQEYDEWLDELDRETEFWDNCRYMEEIVNAE